MATEDEAQSKETQNREIAKWVGVGSFIASLMESVIALLYLLFLTFADKFPRTPNVEFNTADNVEFVSAFLLPVPLCLLFLFGFILGIVGRRSPLGMAGLGLAVIGPFWQGLWFIHAISSH